MEAYRATWSSYKGTYMELYKVTWSYTELHRVIQELHRVIQSYIE